MTAIKLSIHSSAKPIAIETAGKIRERYGQASVNACDVIVAVGGDGFMLDTLRQSIDLNKPVYGVNCGTVGFLMNQPDIETLGMRIADAETAVIHPLAMTAHTRDGASVEAMAINEVSLFRQTRQSARIRIDVNGKTRMPALTCDGVLISTPAGSTAYNLSAHGPILPIGARMLALTPISAFRPRRWKGALLPHDARVRFEALEADQRPVSAVADNQEVRHVLAVDVIQNEAISMRVMFDRGHSLDERILREQFEN